MSGQIKKFAEFFAELAEGLQRIANQKQRFAEVVNYDVGGVIASISGSRNLRQRDVDAGFRNFKLSYHRKDIKALLFARSSELNAEQLCDYFNIGRIYAQRKYSIVRLGQSQLKRFFQLLHDDCEIRRLIHCKKSELCDASFAREAFKEIDFFQNGYIDSYSVYEFVKYYTQRELDPLASTYIVEQFAASEQRINLDAFLAYFEPPANGVLTPAASSVASIDQPETQTNKPAIGKIQKNSPHRQLTRYKSQERFKPLLRDSDSVLDRSDSFERLKDEDLVRKLGKIPDRYRVKPQEEQLNDSIERNFEPLKREHKPKRKRPEFRRAKSPEINHYDRDMGDFEWQHPSTKLIEPKREHQPIKKSPFVRKEEIAESKHETRIKPLQNLEHLQQAKVFKEDRSLETLVSEIEHGRKSHETIEPEEHARYQDYLKAKTKSRVRAQLKTEMTRLSQLLEQREQIVQLLVKGHPQFNCFHGFNVLDSKEVGFLDFREFFGGLEELGIEVSDHNKKVFWRVLSKNSRVSFQNYLSLFHLKWNRDLYEEIKQREPTTLDFSGMESWTPELQISYLKFLASIIDNMVAARQQKEVLVKLVDALPERNLPKFMSEKDQPELSVEECASIFGEGFTRVLSDMRGDSTGSLTTEVVWRYLQCRR